MDVVKLLDVHLLLRTGREVDQRGLARAIARAVRDGYGAGPRGNVEHTAATLLSELGYEQAHEVVRPVEVYGDVADEAPRVLSVNLRALASSA